MAWARTNPRKNQEQPVRLRPNSHQFVFIRYHDLSAKSAEVHLIAFMGNDALIAKSAEALIYANMGDNALNA